MQSSDDKKVETLIGDMPMEPDQWYLVRVSAYVRRTERGRPEIKGFKMEAVKVDSPDEVPPEGEVPPGEATPQ